LRGLLDTSVFIAGEQGRPLHSAALPDEAAVSVVTLAELSLGIHMATSAEIRAVRVSTLTALRASYVALPVDEGVADAFAEIVALARQEGRRPRVQDAWIAATARAHRVPVYTQDADFDDLPGIDVVRV
jgi:predicted nucleic acid-binding protein